MSLGNRSQMLLAACHGRRPSGRPHEGCCCGGSEFNSRGATLRFSS
jgi:hypothetical protein